jgi:hypothetical protein
MSASASESLLSPPTKFLHKVWKYLLQGLEISPAGFGNISYKVWKGKSNNFFYRDHRPEEPKIKLRSGVEYYRKNYVPNKPLNISAEYNSRIYDIM